MAPHRQCLFGWLEMCPTSTTPLPCKTPTHSLAQPLCLFLPLSLAFKGTHIYIHTHTHTPTHTHMHTQPFNGLTSKNTFFLRWEISLNNSSLISPWTVRFWIKERFKEPLIDAHTIHTHTDEHMPAFCLSQSHAHTHTHADTHLKNTRLHTHARTASSWQHCRQTNREWRQMSCFGSLRIRQTWKGEGLSLSNCLCWDKTGCPHGSVTTA